MASIEEFVRHRLGQGQTPRSIKAYLRSWGVKESEIDRVMQKYASPKIKENFPDEHHKLKFVEMLLLTVIGLFLLTAGYKLGESAAKEKAEFTDGASYAARIEHFSGVLRNYSENSWTVETDNGKIVTITNEEGARPAFTIQSQSPLYQNETQLKEGDYVTVYTSIDRDTHNRAVTGIRAER